MNLDKYVFAQIVEFLPNWVFDSIVSKYHGDKGIRRFSCWNQLLCVIFGQISTRDSLRDLMTIIYVHNSKSYHLGFGNGVSRSNLASANEKEIIRFLKNLLFILYRLLKKVSS